MSGALDVKFFKKASKANRAVRYTDTEAIIPAVADKPEIRIPLPNRRPKTMEERQAAIDPRMAEIAPIEEQIETERKELQRRVETFKATGTGAANVIVQNQKVRDLVEKRSSLARPEVWIHKNDSMTLKDVFGAKKALSVLDYPVYDLKRRVEPISSLYIDVGAAAAAEQAAAEAAEGAVLEEARLKQEQKATAAAAAATAATEIPQGPTAQQQARTGAIVGQAKRTIKLGKKTVAGSAAAAGGGGGA